MNDMTKRGLLSHCFFVLAECILDICRESFVALLGVSSAVHLSFANPNLLYTVAQRFAFSLDSFAL